MKIYIDERQEFETIELELYQLRQVSSDRAEIVVLPGSNCL